MASIKRNYLLNGLLSGVNVFFPLLSISYVSRILGPDSLGQYYQANALATYFAMLAGIGIPIYGAREVAKVRDQPDGLNRTFSELFLINLASTAVMIALYAIAFLALPGFAGERRLLALLGFSIAANAFAVDYLFMGLEDFPNIAWRTLATKSASLALIFLCVKSSQDMFLFAAIAVATNLAGSVWGFWSRRRYAHLRFAGLSFQRHLKPLGAISANIALVCVYNNLDSVLLGILSGPHSVALYNAGVRLNRILVGVISSAGVVMIPRMSFFFDRDLHAEAASLAAKSLSGMCFLAFPALAFILVAAPELTALVFGSQFAAASQAMRICSPLVLVIGFTNFIGLQILFPSGEEKLLLAAVALAAVLDVGLIFALSPRWSQNGAAIALLVAESSVLAIQAWAFNRKYGHTAPIGKLSWRYLAATPLAVTPALLWKSHPLPAGVYLLLALLTGAPCYLGALIALRDPMVTEIRKWAVQRLRTSR